MYLEVAKINAKVYVQKDEVMDENIIIYTNV